MSKSNNIQGNCNVSRHMNVGGDTTLQGDALIGHNLVVKGWVDAPNIKGPLKGLYKDESSLKAAYPRPMPGWFALVGNTLPAQVWRADGGEWTPTGETGGEFSIYLDVLEKDVKDVRNEIGDINEMLQDGILIGNSITFNTTGTAASMAFSVLKKDGSVTPMSKDIPIVTQEIAGMMSASDKKNLDEAITDISTLNTSVDAINKSIQSLTEKTETLKNEIAEEAATRKATDELLQSNIDKLTERFDALIGENASEAIDNFTEVLNFLDGLKDTDKLSSKLADLSATDTKQNADILELQKEVWPLEVTFNASQTIVKAGQQTTIRFTWLAKRRGKDVTADSELKFDNAATTGKQTDLTMTLAHGVSQQHTLSVSYAGMEEIRSVNIRGTHPTYFGVVAKTWEATAENVVALGEIINGERVLTRNGISVNDGKIALAYPKDFGALTSVKDGNGYEVLSSYTQSELTVYGITYYVYLLTVPVTAAGVTQIYK